MLDISKNAAQLSRGPLGIIVAMIILVYGMASIVTGTSNLDTAYERLPLIYFLVLFPIAVLAVFAWLVSRHHTNLYPPSDFKDENNFLKAQELKLARASAALVAASMSGPGAKDASEAIEDAVAAVSAASTRRTNTDTHCILWVDDRPENNERLRDAFFEFGIEVHIALSTNQALEALRHRTFGAIISDMGRKEGPTEGYVLLAAVREQGIQTPFFVYAGSNSEEHRKEARRRGAQGSTNDGSELFQNVTQAVLKRRSGRG